METLILIFETSRNCLLNITDNEITVARNKFELCHKLIMDKVPKLHRRIFIYICLFMHEFKRQLGGQSMDLNLSKSFFSFSI